MKIKVPIAQSQGPIQKPACEDRFKIIFKIDLSLVSCFLNCMVCITYTSEWSAVILNLLKFPRYRTLHVQAAWIYMKIVHWLTNNFALIYDIQGSCRIFVISIVAIAMIGTGFNSRELIISIDYILYSRIDETCDTFRIVKVINLKSCLVLLWHWKIPISSKWQNTKEKLQDRLIKNLYAINIGWMIDLESENSKFWWTEKTEYFWLWFMIRHVMRIVQNYRQIWLRLGLF